MGTRWSTKGAKVVPGTDFNGFGGTPWTPKWTKTVPKNHKKKQSSERGWSTLRAARDTDRDESKPHFPPSCPGGMGEANLNPPGGEAKGVLARPGTPRDPKSHLLATKWVAIKDLDAA